MSRLLTNMWYGSVLNSDTALIQDMKDNTAYTVQDRWVEMPIAEYINGYRDHRRVRGYCLECGRYGKCWACPPFNFDEGQYLRQFTTISLLATKITPSEGVTLTQETMDRIISLERQRLDKMLLGMEGNARAFFAGTCLLCPPEQCTRRKGLPTSSTRPCNGAGTDSRRNTSPSSVPSPENFEHFSETVCRFASLKQIV